MNSGNSVQDPDLHSASAVSSSDAAAGGPGKLGTESQDPEGPQDRLTGMPSGARSSLQHVQDIQEIVDKLAAVTKQLRQPGHS
jgi:hypothetical protein